MLKKLNTHPKYLAIAGTGLLLLICYQLAFKNTLEAFKTNLALKSQLSQSSDLTYQPGYLERKNKNLDIILDRYKLDSLSLRGNTLADISLLAGKENVSLSEVPIDDPFLHTNQFIIERLNFQGKFISLVKILNYIEANAGSGIIRSVEIKSISNHQQESVVSKTGMEVLIEISR